MNPSGAAVAAGATEPVLLSIAGPVATVVLNRPDKLNAFNAALHAALRSVLDTVEHDPAVRVVVLTGAGRAFSAGQDLTEDLPRNAAGGFDVGEALRRDYNPLVTRLINFPKVTIAAVNGPAVGASMNIALCCDLVIAARSAYFQEGFARIALVPDAAGTWLLPRLIGLKRALGLCLTAEQVSAEEAERIGLIYKVLEDEGFMGQVRVLAGMAAQGPAHAFRLIKKGLNASLDNTLTEQLQLESELQQAAADHSDFAEGVAAFREKRLPRFNR